MADARANLERNEAASGTHHKVGIIMTIMHHTRDRCGGIIRAM